MKHNLRIRQQKRFFFLPTVKLFALTEHDVVDGVSVHVLLFEFRGKKFDVASATVNALLVFHSELND